MRLKYFIRFSLLMIGFALTTLGLLAWAEERFELNTMWPLADVLTAHPVYLVVLGLALIPPTLWEIFILEQRRDG